jgi:hypothetical protein
MSIPAKKFYRVCDQFPVFRAYLINRGIQRRCFFRKVERDLLIRTGIVDKEVYEGKKKLSKKEVFKRMTRVNETVSKKLIKGVESKFYKAWISKESMQINFKRLQQNFQPKSLLELVDSEMMAIDEKEIPKNHHGVMETLVLFQIPLTRNLLDSSVLKLKETTKILE